MDEEIAEIVRQHGWYAAAISDHQPPFVYTIGLLQTLNHPEFIVFGLETEVAHALLSQIVRGIRGGRTYAQPGAHTFNLGGDEYRVGLRRVHPTQHACYLGFAMGYCRQIGSELQAMQAFWPDRSGRFPFDVGCELDVYQLQPRLDIGLTPRELGRWERQWE